MFCVLFHNKLMSLCHFVLLEPECKHSTSRLQYFGHLMQRATRGKYPNVGKIDRQEEKGMTEDEMVGWHRQLSGRESEQTLGGGEGQGSLCAAAHGITKSWTELGD